ncbi:MAG: MFS transporter [Gemmobacter sp.]
MRTLRRSGATRLTPLLVCFAAGSLYGWSGLSQVVRAKFDVGHTQVGQVFSVAILAFTLGVLLAPMLARHVGTARGMALAALAGAACLAAVAVARTFVQVLLGYGAGFGLCAGLVYALALTLAARTGPRVTAVAVAGFGLGGILFGTLFRRAAAAGAGLDALWPAAALLGAAALVALAAPQSVDPADPKDPGTQPSAASAHQRMLLWMVFFGGSAAGLMVLGQSTAMVEDLGASVTLSTAVVAGVAAGNTGGRLLVAVAATRFGAARILQAALAVVCCGLAVLLMAAGPGMALTGAVTVATGYGLVAASVPVMTREIAGTAGFARAFGPVFTAWGVAGLVAPWAAGAMRDASGSFALPLLAALGLAGAAAVVAFALRSGARSG